MKLKVYAVHDSAVKNFNTPHYCQTHGEAERNFKSAVNNEKNGHLYAYPEHFTLFHIGEYDQDTGQTESHAPMAIITGVQVKEQMTDKERQLRMAGT